MIQFSKFPLLSNNYVGLNFTWRCDVRIPGSQLLGVNAVIEWIGPSGMLTSTSDGRLTVGALEIDTPGRQYERSVMFSPLSAGDSGSYSCSATIMPDTENSRVTNGVQVGSDSLSVASE